MRLSNIVIVMIKLEMITSSWILNSKRLCWKLDIKNNHEMVYDSRILVSDSLHRLISSVRIFNAFFARFYCFFFYWCSLFINKNDKRTSYKKAADLSTIILQIFINNYKSMITMHPKKCCYSDHETPIDLAVIGYSSGNFVGSILRTWC